MSGHDVEELADSMHTSFSLRQSCVSQSPTNRFSQTLTSATGLQIVKTVLTPGDGIYCPMEGSVCTLHVNTISVPDRVNAPIMGENGLNTSTWTLGDYDSYCGEAIDLVVASMKQGEKCKVNVPCDSQECASNASSDSDPFPGSSPEIVLEVVLSSFEPGTDVWKLSAQEKLALAVTLKSQGNTFFQKGIQSLAFSKYSRSLKYLLCMGTAADIPDKIAAEVKMLKLQCYLNLSACQLQHQHHTAVIQNCTEALNLDPDSVKGLYRRAQAHIHLHSLDLAQDDLRKAARLQPQNKAVLKGLGFVSQALKKQDSQMASAMSKLFT